MKIIKSGKQILHTLVTKCSLINDTKPIGIAVNVGYWSNVMSAFIDERTEGKREMGQRQARIHLKHGLGCSVSAETKPRFDD